MKFKLFDILKQEWKSLYSRAIEYWYPERFIQYPIRAEILIVEDDKEQSDILNQLFTLQDTKVDVVHNAKDALEKLSQIKYHIVIIDLKLPDSSGLTILEKIKESCRMTHPIICSGYFMPAIFNFGYVGILPKPFSFNSVREILVKHRLHRSD